VTKRLASSLALALLVLAAALPARAQEGFWVGLKGGYGSPASDVSTDLLILKGTADSGGVVAGLSFEGGWWKNLTLESELLYVSRKAANTYFGGTNDHGQYQGDVSADYTFETLEFPLHARYTFGSGTLNPFVLAGASVAVPLSIESTNRSGSATATENARDQFEDAWLALEAGAGVEIRAGARTVLTLDARYVHGLTNIAATGGDSWKWRDWRILGGLRFRM
jgi:hypothetical protein